MTAALVAVYALAGFLFLPWMAQRELPRYIEQNLHQRALAIEAELKSAGADTARLATVSDKPSADAGAKQLQVQLRLAAR